MNWLRNTFEISHSKHTTIRAMEGISGFAAFLVFIVHYVTLFEHRLLHGEQRRDAIEKKRLSLRQVVQPKMERLPDIFYPRV